MINRIRDRAALAWLLVLGGVGGAAFAGSSERWVALADEVSAEAIRRHTVVLGGDALEGEAPGSRGGRMAAAYIAGELEKLGVEPLGDDGSYFQQVPLVGSTPLPESRLTISGLGDQRVLALGEDYLLHTTGARTLLPRPTPLVFVGYGIVAPEFDYNDYADVDVRGKAVVFLAGEPASDDPDHFGGGEPTTYSAVESKVRMALSRGAVAGVWCRAAAWSGPVCSGSTPSNTSVSPHRCRATSRSCCVRASPPACLMTLFSVLTRSCPWNGARSCARSTCR